MKRFLFRVFILSVVVHAQQTAARRPAILLTPTKSPTDRPTSSKFRQPAQTTPTSVVTIADAIKAADARIRGTIRLNPDIAATYLRLGFHDCLPDGIAGGCDGCLNLDNPANFGLAPAVQALAPIVQELENTPIGFSRADIWALSVLVASDMSQSNLNFTAGFRVGRRNCESKGTCSRKDPTFCASFGPDVVEDFPSTSFTTHELIDFFTRHFGFDANQTLAIMGAHTIGRALTTNSGFLGDNGWVPNRFVLDNEYYRVLVGSPELVEGPEYFQSRVIDTGRLQWMRADDNRAIPNFMTDSDIAIARDLAIGDHLQDDGQVTCSMFLLPIEKRCPVADTLTKAGVYRNNNAEWLRDFKAVLVAMIEKGL